MPTSLPASGPSATAVMLTLPTGAIATSVSIGIEGSVYAAITLTGTITPVLALYSFTGTTFVPTTL